ncbi:class I SAM-dependent methyltransferase [Microbacterium sp. APC 3898]|uniref:Class I SAM-dependent methyltransferase n=1 Tax=Planococcus notacanthi TaxID=3035188 RepID=A0ABT7ZGR3_9BACL|nr:MULTISPECIES: class I SAM-dependent methyltransferase [Terrabacteria group]MDN3426345.1 class I SAM-dependent methyltransferase [Planococcus sp. APC 4016]MDN3438815.1 class I SAM-dependent methyltransferase [Planococcus sp. APC 3900]MDN3498041.1 class I SAM-dependent methyltransferase [Microbacterium sp. APC 3898]
MPNKHREPQGTTHGHHHGKISYLEHPERRKAFSPETLLKRIPLKNTDSVLDFGAGTGYFTIPAAKQVDGVVYAIDTDLSMLEMIKTKAAKEELTNIVPIQGGEGELSIPKESIDVVIASLVLHEIDPLTETLMKMKEWLKAGGHLAVVELEPKIQPAQKAPRISLIGMEKAIEDAGLRITDKFFPADSLYVLIARKHEWAQGE